VPQGLSRRAKTIVAVAASAWQRRKLAPRVTTLTGKSAMCAVQWEACRKVVEGWTRRLLCVSRIE
jgi:hypothetical protein